MYPANFFVLFPPFPRDEKVFVAMSFDPCFDRRWHEVIDPGIRNVSVNDKRLEAVRVDTRKVSDSILTEILTGVANSRLVLADITTIGHLDERPVRNGNVMYEVGLAQAVRLPEEVILFRSDDDALLFDTSNIRINRYAPDDTPDQARSQVSDAIIAAIQELDLRRHMAVQKAVESLDFPSWWLLMKSKDGIAHPEMRTVGQLVGNLERTNAIKRLLELGAIMTSYLKMTPELLNKIGDSTDVPLLKYQCTAFGEAIVREGADRIGLFSPEIRTLLEKKFAESDLSE